MTDELTLGVGIVTHHRRDELISAVSALVASGLVSNVVVDQTGGRYTLPKSLRVGVANVLHFEWLDIPENSVPLARHMAETRLREMESDLFMILDDDEVIYADFLEKCLTVQHWHHGPGLQVVTGGLLRACWVDPGAMTDDQYAQMMRDRNLLAGGTVMYPRSLLGTWEKVYQLGGEYPIDDLAWQFLVNKRPDTLLMNLGWGALHLSPAEPHRHDGGEEKFAEFKKAYFEL